MNNKRKKNLFVVVTSAIIFYMFFLVFTFVFESQKSFSKNKEDLTANLLYTDGNLEFNSNSTSNILKVNELLKPNEVVSYTSFMLDNVIKSAWTNEAILADDAWKIKIDDNEKIYSNDFDSISRINMGIYFEDESTNFYLKSEKDDFENNNDKLFVHGDTFKNDNDIILDEEFAKKLDSNYSNLIGKSISITMKNTQSTSFKINNEEVDKDYYKDKYFDILKEFRICGIINSEFKNYSSRNINHYIWVKSNAINLDYMYIDYDKDVIDISSEITAGGKIFLPFGFRGHEHEYFEQRFQIMQFNSLSKLQYIKYNLKSNDINVRGLLHNISFSEAFEKYDKYYQVFKYVSMVSFSTVVIVLFAYLLIDNVKMKKKVKYRYLYATN